jgi:hypothetical protein
MTLLLAGWLASPLLAQSAQTLSVSALMDIWQAGGYNDGSGGSLPAVYTFSAASGQSLAFFQRHRKLDLRKWSYAIRSGRHELR